MNYQPDMISTIIKMVGALVVLLGGLWIVSGYLKKLTKTNGLKSGGKKIKVIENCYVGVKKTISLVEVPGAVLVLGIAGDNITMLTKLEDDVLTDLRQEKDLALSNTQFSKQFFKFATRVKTAGGIGKNK